VKLTHIIRYVHFVLHREHDVPIRKTNNLILHKETMISCQNHKGYVILTTDGVAK